MHATATSSARYTMLAARKGVDYDYSIDQQDIGATTSGTTTYVQDYDAVLMRVTGGSHTPEYQLTVQEGITGSLHRGILYDSLSPSIATVDGNGLVERVADGTARIRVRTPRWPAQVVSLDMSQVNPATTNVLQRFVKSGDADGNITKDSLAYACCNAIDTAIAGLDASNIPIFSARDHAAQTYTRNASCWAADFDLTGIPVWQSRNGTQFVCAAVADDLLIGAWHAVGSMSAGTTFRFVAADNAVVNRTVTSVKRAGSTDIAVIRLNADLPASIKRYKLMPALYPYIRNLQYGVAALTIRQNNEATVRDLYISGASNSYRKSSYGSRGMFYKDLVVGDSACPAFLIVDGEPVLLNTWHTGGGGGGPMVSYYLDDVNAAIAATGSSATVEVADLSAWDVWEWVARNAGASMGWRLGESGGTTAADTTGHGNDGTATNVTWGRTGIIANDADKAAAFTRSSPSYITAPGKMIPATADFSMMCFFRADVITYDFQLLIAQYTSGTTGRFYMGIKYSGGKPYFTLFNDAPVGDRDRTGVEANTWYFMVVTRSGNNWKMYLDGAKIMDHTKSYSIQQINTTIGAAAGGTGLAFEGDIDEVYLYPRTLTEAEVKCLYCLANNSWPTPTP